MEEMIGEKLPNLLRSDRMPWSGAAVQRVGSFPPFCFSDNQEEEPGGVELNMWFFGDFIRNQPDPPVYVSHGAIMIYYILRFLSDPVEPHRIHNPLEAIKLMINIKNF